METKFIKTNWNLWVIGLGVGIKQHGGDYHFPGWAGWWCLSLHICFLDIQIKLWKGKKDE